MSDEIKSDGVWIKFQLDEAASATRKTNIWNVLTLDERHALGQVRWQGSWRNYAFFPAYGTIFEQTCLRDIAEFVEKSNLNHRERLKAEKV